MLVIALAAPPPSQAAPSCSVAVGNLYKPIAAGTSLASALVILAMALTCGVSGVHFEPPLRYSSSALARALTSAIMNGSFSVAHLALTAKPSKVGYPLAPMLPELAIDLPLPFILLSTGSQMKAASISPRSHAAAISGGRIFMTLTELASSPSSFMIAISW